MGGRSFLTMAKAFPYHDRFFRWVFSRPDTAHGLVREYLPADVVARLDLGTLEIWHHTHVAESQRESRSDAVYRVRLVDGRRAWVYVLVEHKSGPDRPDRPVAAQLLRYLAALWELHGSAGGGLPLPVVIPLVIHHGPRPWKLPTELAEMVEASGALAPFVPRLRYLLLDLRVTEDEQVRGDPPVRATLLALRHVFDKDLRGRVVEILAELRGYGDLDERSHWVRAVYEYLWRTAGRRMRGVDLVDVVARAFPGPEGEELMIRTPQTFIDEGIEKGKVAKAREDVIEVLELRFGSVPSSVRERIEGTEELSALRRLHRSAVTTASLDAFTEALESVASETR